MRVVKSVFGGDAPPPPKPEPVVEKAADTKEAKTRAKKRRARLAGARGLLSGGFKGFGDEDKLGG